MGAAGIAQMTILRADHVCLRPFRDEEVEHALGMIGFSAPDRATEGDTVRALRRDRLTRSGSRNEWELLFAIEGDGRLVGEIQARHAKHAMPPGVHELGIEIWDRSDRRRGYGSAAIVALAGHLFEREEAIRVQASTDLDNDGMRRTLEGLGFGFEGVLRSFMPSPDGPRDYAMYGMTHDDWKAVRSRWTRAS
jgi:RimJ/RimL family protein N-acetyltransferase